MLSLKKYQEKAVKQLLEYTCDSLQEANKRIQILLKAPTGAGKTVTMATFLSRLVQEVSIRPNLPRDIAFIWLAPNTLHLQSYYTLKGFYDEMRDLRAIQIDDLTNNSELQAKDILFVNWSKLDNEKKIFRRTNELNFNLETLLEKTYSQGTEIIVIIDEAHLSAFTGEQAQNVLTMIDAKIEISVTATPNQIPDMNVVIQRQKVVAEEMIKKGIMLNQNLSAQEQSGEMLDLHLLKKAMNKRDEIAKAYSDLGIDINPLLLIQLPSERVILTDEDKNKRILIEKYLDGFLGITTDNGLLSVWLSDSKDKINLEGLEKPNAPQKVLIFKQAISQGWDCPRAAVLIIFREIGNTTFGIQTVGRILRMPEQRHYDNDLLDYGYAFTNIQSNNIIFQADDLDYFNTQIAKRRENITCQNLKSSYIVNDRDSAGYLLSNFNRLFFKLIEEEYGIEQIPELTLFSTEEEETINAQFEFNRKALEQKFWNLNADEIEIKIPTNITIDSYEVDNQVSGRIENFSKTQAELSELLDRFCYDSITLLNRAKSWKVLKSTLIEFVEYYIGFDEYKARKVLLYSANQAILIELIQKALERYDVWQKERGNKNKRQKTTEWQVPAERSYSEVYHKKSDVINHALSPYYELNNVSNPELKFSELLEQHKDKIEWWYKNGDKGKEHFAISYKNIADELSLFYVDFVIHFKSGKIGLFDTKTKRSDYEAPQKHNALIDYIKNENQKNPNLHLFGGITIAQEINGVVTFRYSNNNINDTNDLTGWVFFNPATI